MNIRYVMLTFATAGILALAGVSTVAWAQDATPDPVDHAAHHATGAADGSMAGMAMTGTMESTAMTKTMPGMPMTDTTSMPAVDHAAHHAIGNAPSAMGNMPMTGTMGADGMGMMGMMSDMQAMEAMMGKMEGMEMSPEMKAMMAKMKGKMGDMMKHMDMAGGDMAGMGDMAKMHADMQAMMADMQGMKMSPEMKAMMGKMQGMMDSMPMHAGGDAAMAGMNHGSNSDTMAGMDHGQGTDSMAGMDRGSGTDTMAGMDQAGGADAMAGMDHAMAGHAMEPIPAAGVPAASQSVGGQPLAAEVEDGVKVFRLTAEPVIWNITDDVTVTAWTYNGSVPGPLLRATEGDKVRVILTNDLPEATTIHWHGIDVPNSMDGVPGMPTAAIQPGETFTYEFTVNTPGSYMYHSHTASDKQVSVGLYAPFIIDPATPPADEPAVDAALMLSEWRVVDGQTYPAMPMAGAEPNYFTINGKAFPATEKLTAKVGEPIRLRLMNIGQFVHPIHVHGASFKVVATDGHQVPEAAQLTKDTISVSPGERYDIEMVFNEPGQWMVHCHILHHTTNNGADEGGMMLVIDVTE